MKIYSLFLVLLLLPQVVSALSLEEMQRAALDNRALVKRYETDIEKSIENIRIARSGYYPSLDLGYRTYTIDEPTPTERRENSVISGAVSWNIFTGFKDKYSISSAEVLRDVETFKLNSIEQDLQLAVALRYLAVFNQQARLKVAQDTNKTLKGLYRDSKNRFEVGLLDRNAVLKFKVDYDNADLTVKKEQADLQKAIYELVREVDLDIDYNKLDFKEFKATPALDQNEDYEQSMLAQRSELKVLEGLAESAELFARAQYGDYYPRFDLVGRYRNYDDSLLNGQGEFTDEELRAELIMSYNLFGGFGDAERVKALTCRTRGRSLRQIIGELNSYLTGWWQYYCLTDSVNRLRPLAHWIRRRLRALVWKQWKNRRTRVQNLLKCGLSRQYALTTGCARKGPWRMSIVKWVVLALPDQHFHSLGLSFPWLPPA